MKKHPANYTKGERKFVNLVEALKAGKPNAAIYRKNSAVTLCSWDKDGNALDDDLSDLVLGSVHTSVRTI